MEGKQIICLFFAFSLRFDRFEHSREVGTVASPCYLAWGWANSRLVGRLRHRRSSLPRIICWVFWNTGRRIFIHLRYLIESQWGQRFGVCQELISCARASYCRFSNSFLLFEWDLNLRTGFPGRLALDCLQFDLRLYNILSFLSLWNGFDLWNLLWE